MERNLKLRNTGFAASFAAGMLVNLIPCIGIMCLSMILLKIKNK